MTRFHPETEHVCVQHPIDKPMGKREKRFTTRLLRRRMCATCPLWTEVNRGTRPG